MTDDNLYMAVDEILCYIWDPIKVSADGTPETRDEYTRYVPKVVELMKRNESIEVIASHLDDIEENRMGHNADKNRNIEVAKILLNKYKFLLER